MAEGYSVGNLKIAFSALDKTSDDFKRLEANLRAVVNLVNRISTVNLGNFTTNIQEITRSFSPFLNKVNEATTGLQALGDAVRQVSVANMSSVAAELDEIQSRSDGASSGVNELNSEIKDTAKAAASGAKELNKLADAEKQADNAARKTEKGGLSKLLNRVGITAQYRSIRRMLQMITSTFTESVQAYAQVDDNINQTMSQLTSSAQIIKLSLGTTLLPIIQAITPAVQSLSVGFADMANAISKSMALAQGNSTYMRIDTKAISDYRKELEKTTGALFDFDKFRVLSSNKNTKSASSFLIQETVSELTKAEMKYNGIYATVSGIGGLLNSVFETIEKIGQSSAFQMISTVVGGVAIGLSEASGWLLDILDTSGLLEPILGGIAGYFTYIGASKLFIALGGGKLLKWIGAVVSLLKYDASETLKMLAGDITKVMSTTKMLALSIGALSASVLYLIQNWGDMSTTARALTLSLSLISAAIVGVFTALVAVKWAGLGIGAAIKAGLSAAALTAAIGIAIGTAASTAKKEVAAFANGGIPAQGTLFYAGEAGAEMVYNTPSGQSGVANVQQIAQADYQGTLAALNDWWKTAKNEIGGDVYLDSEKIYQGVGRAASKHGKRFADVR